MVPIYTHGWAHSYNMRLEHAVDWTNWGYYIHARQRGPLTGICGTTLTTPTRSTQWRSAARQSAQSASLSAVLSAEIWHVCCTLAQCLRNEGHDVCVQCWNRRMQKSCQLCTVLDNAFTVPSSGKHARNLETGGEIMRLPWCDPPCLACPLFLTHVSE